MNTTFNEFILANPNYQRYADNREAKEIFEKILSREENIISMIEASENAKPALSACVLEVEAYYNNSVSKEFDLKDNFTKQGLGRMVKSILEPFGYVVVGQKDMPKVLNIEYITSASTYQLNGIPQMKVAKNIVACQ